MQQPTYADLVARRREQLRREQRDRARELAARLRPVPAKALPTPCRREPHSALVVADVALPLPPAPAPILVPDDHKRDWLIVATSVQVGRVRIAEIKNRIAARHGITIDEMESTSRDTRFARARQEVMYFAHALSAQSLPAIGRALGDRDHTTVLHGVRAFAARSGIPVDADKSTALRWLYEGVRA